MQQWPYAFLIFATRNENKRKQIAQILREKLNVEVKSLNDFNNLPEIIEDKSTFEGNACKKAEEISGRLRVPVIADDSGLVVPALDGRPGIHSARYAGPNCNDDKNNEKLMNEIALVPENERNATFVSVMAVALPNEETYVVRGEIDGVILQKPRGSGGFGYQPLFYLPKEDKTMAELSDERRNEISHRALATYKVMKRLMERYRFGR